MKGNTNTTDLRVAEIEEDYNNTNTNYKEVVQSGTTSLSEATWTNLCTMTFTAEEDGLYLFCFGANVYNNTADNKRILLSSSAVKLISDPIKDYYACASDLIEVKSGQRSFTIQARSATAGTGAYGFIKALKLK